ncbi:Fur family transcriptional regulator [Sulfurimonas sp. HSL-1716]|uniref:Fur family transcriptional regulator n=1 Tax=Hydrocurvibacter sulfurireducens TaxID=3131937 RepID=UPI0031F9DAF5
MNYENLLRKHGLKVTPQRLGILTLMETRGHINVDEMYNEIKKQFPSISLATMYKNIIAMTETSLIKEVKVPQQKTRFEIVKSPHGHLLCDSCGDFVDIELDIDGLIEDVSKKSRYKLLDTSLVFCGICPGCA